MEAKRQSRPFVIATVESGKDSRFSGGSSDYLHSAEPTNLPDALRAPWQSPEAQSNSRAAFSPVAVMKNTVAKQGGNSSQFQSRKVQPSWENIPAHPQLAVLHPLIPSTFVTLQAARGGKGDSSDVLSILNSYAKKASQPYKRSLEVREETSRQKRLCTSGTDTSPNQVSSFRSGLCHWGPLGSRPPRDFVRQNLPGGSAAAVNGFRCVSITKPNAPDSAPVSAAPASCESEHQARNPAQSALCNPAASGKERCSSSDQPSQQPSKNKRFQNTLVVLHRSGLLEITLKTKKLISQNQMTQAELEQLKQQTQLFAEALKNKAPQAWTELEASLMQLDKATNSLLTYPES